MKHFRLTSFSLFVVLVAIFFGQRLDAQTIRVLLAFTPEAEAEGFNPVAAALIINDATANIYANSSPTYTGYQMPKMELAGTVRTNYSGSTTHSAVVALKSKTDTIMNNVHAARDFYKADVVLLIHPFTDNGGEAAKSETPNETWAFAVVSTSAIREPTTSTMPAHEIGHLVGCVHDFQDPFYVPPSMKYAYGFVGPSNAWGDVMTYNDSIMPWFGNPYETYGGVPRGIVDSADCTRKHHERKSTIAGYRTTPTSWGVANDSLKENESIFWKLPGNIWFEGNSFIPASGLLSLQAAQGVSLWSYPSLQITSEGSIYLRSETKVEVSGNYQHAPDEYSSVLVAVGDSVLFPSGINTNFQGIVMSLNANVIRHESGSTVTIGDSAAPSTGIPYVTMAARDQIHLGSGFKIRGGQVRMYIIDTLDVFGDDWGTFLPKASARGQAEAAPAASTPFESRLTQDHGRGMLEFILPQTSDVSLRIVDVRGKTVFAKRLGRKPKGSNVVAIPETLERGTLYLIQLNAGKNSVTHKFFKSL